MQPLTHTIMTNILSLLLAVLACFTATGCDSDNTTFPETTSTEKKVVYDLPEGWEWSGGNVMPTGDAIKWVGEGNRPEQTEIDGPGFYKIGDFTFQEGDEAMVEANVLEGFNSAFDGRSCDKIPCTWINDYLDYENSVTVESKTINGQTVIVTTNYMDQGDYKFWSHGLNFEKDGIVYKGAIYGNEFDTFTEPLETILGSIRVE